MSQDLKLAELLTELDKRINSLSAKNFTPGRKQALEYFREQIAAKKYHNLNISTFIYYAELFLETDNFREKRSDRPEANFASEIEYAVLRNAVLMKGELAYKLTRDAEQASRELEEARKFVEEQREFAMSPSFNNIISEQLAYADRFKYEIANQPQKVFQTLSEFNTNLRTKVTEMVQGIEHEFDTLRNCTQSALEDEKEEKHQQSLLAILSTINRARTSIDRASKLGDSNIKNLQNVDAELVNHAREIVGMLSKQIRAYYEQFERNDSPCQNIGSKAVRILNQLLDPRYNLAACFIIVPRLFRLMVQIKKLDNVILKVDKEKDLDQAVVIPQKMKLLEKALSHFPEMKDDPVQDTEMQIQGLDKIANQRNKAFIQTYIDPIKQLFPNEKLASKDSEHVFVYQPLQKLRAEVLNKYKRELYHICCTTPQDNLEQACNAAKKRCAEFIKLAEALNKVTAAYRSHKKWEPKAKIDNEFRTFLAENRSIYQMYLKKEMKGDLLPTVTPEYFDEVIQRLEAMANQKEKRAGGFKTIAKGSKFRQLVEEMVVKPYLHTDLSTHLRNRRAEHGTSSVISRLFNRVKKTKPENTSPALQHIPGHHE